LIGELPEYFCGGAKRRSPTGGTANGIPRYSDTCDAFNAGWPLTGPLSVWTVWPTIQSDCLSSTVFANEKAGTARKWRREAFMMVSFQRPLLIYYTRNNSFTCLKGLRLLRTLRMAGRNASTVASRVK